MAEADEFDCLLIESSGISEPIQVAETFTTCALFSALLLVVWLTADHPTLAFREFAESLEAADVTDIEASLPVSEGQTTESRRKVAALIAAGGLSKVARLDTCVTVVSAVSFLDDFDTDHFLSDRHGDQVTSEDERNVTDLYVGPCLPASRVNLT